MAKSSIHFEKTDASFAKKHNSREEEPTYLLPKKFWQGNIFEEKISNEELRKLYDEQIKIRRKNHARGSTPTLKNSQTEAVINLNSTHSLDDVKRVAAEIEKSYGFKTVSLAIHRDEGHLESRNGKEFPVYNYHAHVVFFTLKDGISMRRKLGSKELEEINTLTAKLLVMERGESKTQRWERVAGMLGVSVEEIRRKDKSEAPNDYIKRIAELAKRKGFENFNIYEEVKPKKRLSAKEFRQVAKEKSEIVKRAKLAVLEQVQPVLQNSVNEKKQLHGTVKQLTNKVLTLKAQKAIVEAERKRWKEAHDFVAGEYRKLQALNKTLYTEEQLNEELQKLRDEHALRLTELQNKNTELQEKLETKPKEVVKEVIKTVEVEKIVEKPIQVEVPVETVKEIIVPRQLTDSEIEELPKVKKQSEELECAQGRISYLEQAYNQTLDNYSVLQNDYNILANDYRKLNTEYNLLKRSKTNDDTSECSRVRIDTENQSENILEAYARKIGYSKSEPEQTDKLHGTEEPTQTTSPLRSTRGFHR